MKSCIWAWFVSLSGGRFHAIIRNLVCERGLFPSLVVVLTLFYEILCERGLFPSLVIVLTLFYEILYVSVVCFPLWRSF